MPGHVDMDETRPPPSQGLGSSGGRPKLWSFRQESGQEAGRRSWAGQVECPRPSPPQHLHRSFPHRSHGSPDSHQQRLQLALCGGLGEFLPEQENVARCSPDLCNASGAQALQLAGVTWALLGAPGCLLPWGRAQL